MHIQGHNERLNGKSLHFVDLITINGLNEDEEEYEDEDDDRVEIRRQNFSPIISGTNHNHLS